MGNWEYNNGSIPASSTVCFWPCDFIHGDNSPEELCYTNGQSCCVSSFRSYDGTVTDGEGEIAKKRRKREVEFHRHFVGRGMRQRWRFRFGHDEDGPDLLAPYYQGGVGTWYCQCPQHRTGIYCEYGCPDREDPDNSTAVYVSNYVRVVDRCYMDVTMFQMNDTASAKGLVNFTEALALLLASSSEEIGYLPVIYDNRSRDHFTEFIHEHAGINYDTAWIEGAFSVDEAQKLDAQYAGFNRASERQYWTAFHLGGDNLGINFCWDQIDIQSVCNHAYCNNLDGLENNLHWHTGATFMYEEMLHQFDCIALRQHQAAPSNFIVDFVDCEVPLFPAIGTHDTTGDDCNGTVVGAHCFTIYEGGRKVTFDDAARIVGEHGDVLLLGSVGNTIPSDDGSDDHINAYKAFADANDNIGTWLPLRIKSSNGSCYQFAYPAPVQPTAFNEAGKNYPIREGEFQYALNALLNEGDFKHGVAMTYSANGEWHVVSKSQKRYLIAESRLWNWVDRWAR